jgi:hypothetical protein
MALWIWGRRESRWFGCLRLAPADIPFQIGNMDLLLTTRRLAPALLVSGLMTLGLGGCSWFHHGDKSAKTAPPPPVCPLVAIVPQLAQASQFDGPATGYSSLTYTASLSSLTSKCSFEKHGISIDATFTLTVQQGPKGTGGTLDFPYFVAILDPAGSVLDRAEFSTPLTLDANRIRLGSKEAVHEYIPLDDKTAAGSYGVAIGFQLDQRQVDFNRTTGVGD